MDKMENEEMIKIENEEIIKIENEEIDQILDEMRVKNEVECGCESDRGEAFLMFIRPIENVILNMTNLNGRREYENDWENIDMDTLHAYFGVLLLTGLYRIYGECVTQLWNEKSGRPIFRDIMPLNTYKRIRGCMLFDDREKRNKTTTTTDKFAPIRNVYDLWNENLKKIYVPGKMVTVEEQLVPFRGRCPFRVHMPSKPAKYGIKIWVLCDSTTSYVYNTQVCVDGESTSDLLEGLSDSNVIELRNKGDEVDTIDQLVATFTCKRKVNRWTMAVFCNILDISALNAFIVFTSMFPDWNKTGRTNRNIRRRMFIEQLAMDLAKAHIEKRKGRPQKQQIQAPNICDLPEMRHISHLPSTSKRGRCYICTWKNNKNVFASRCDRCTNYVCSEHKLTICEGCVRD